MVNRTVRCHAVLLNLGTGSPEVYWESLPAYPYKTRSPKEHCDVVGLAPLVGFCSFVGCELENFSFFFSGKDIQLESSECPSQGLCPGGSTAFEVPQRFSIFSKPIYQHPVISTHPRNFRFLLVCWFSICSVISYWKIPPRNADGSPWVPLGPPAMATVCSSARSTPEEASARMKHWS